MKTIKRFVLGVGAAVLLAPVCWGAFEMDKSVMSDAYWKVWNDDVQKKIDAGIEKNRKADAVVKIAAVDGTEVKVEQISHAFFFGAHIFNFNQLGKHEWNERYKELFGTLFNSATVAFYWRTMEPYANQVRFGGAYQDTEEYWNNCVHPEDEPNWRRPAPDEVIDFLKARGLRIHGHPLVWGSWEWHRPTWLWDGFCPEEEKFALEQKTGVKIPTRNWKLPVGVKDRGDTWNESWQKIFKMMSEEEIAAVVPTFLKNYEYFYEKRIREIAERYGSRVDSWDVVNESAPDFHVSQGEKAVRGVACQKTERYGLMPGDYAYKAFRWAEKYLPRTAWFNINDFDMSSYYAREAKALIAAGARVDVVGSQMHLFNPAESVNIKDGKIPEHLLPEKIEERFRMLAEVGRPIHLSEITITAPDNSWNGQMVQAIIMRNLYRAWFAIKEMNGITWWNVVDNCGAPGEPSISGIFTRDMRPKTAYYAMDDLINREWKTKCAAKVAGGQIAFRGFRGKYRLTWKDAAGKEQTKLIEVK